MSKAEIALQLFDEGRNCAQAVLSAYAGDFGLDPDIALSLAMGFGAGMGGRKEVCGAISGAFMVMGLQSNFKDGQGREKINAVYAQERQFAEEFTRQMGTMKCAEILSRGKTPASDAAQKSVANPRENCRAAIRLACELLETQPCDFTNKN